MYEDYYHEPKYLSEDDKELVQEIFTALFNGQHEHGVNLVQQRLRSEQPAEGDAYAELRFLLGGFLIDFGGDKGDATLIHEGVKILEDDAETISRHFGQFSVDYCLGNAKYSLYGLAVKNGKIKFKPENLDLLTEAKNYFWQAIKSAGIRAAPNLYVNLGNALDTAGRVIEAIRWYNHALEIDSGFAMAHINRGMALGTLNGMSDTYSIAMLLQMERHFQIATKDPSLPSRAQAEAHLKHVKRALESHDVSESLEAHDEHTKQEWEKASAFRKFCVTNHLTLNEHSLYCHCIGGQDDNLSIPKASGPIGGNFVPSMELLLNRMRAEFAMARMLFYQHEHPKTETDDFEVEYSELFDNEIVGLPSEYLRTSFRLCFGILDRIAFAVCNLFNLAEPQEHIYFESFWKKPRSKTRKEKERWEKINDAENWGLTALYSQAKDLNAKKGEWGHFKLWRNHLEHEALLLTNQEEIDLGPWIAKTFGSQIRWVDLATFKKETLHLLQVTAAAIFYFTFCVRQEGIKVHASTKAPTLQMTIDKRQRDE